MTNPLSSPRGQIMLLVTRILVYTLGFLRLLYWHPGFAEKAFFFFWGGVFFGLNMFVILAFRSAFRWDFLLFRWLLKLGQSKALSTDLPGLSQWGASLWGSHQREQRSDPCFFCPYVLVKEIFQTKCSRFHELDSRRNSWKTTSTKRESARCGLQNDVHD